MNKDMLPYLFLMLGGVFLAAISQVLLKKSALKTYSSRVKEYLNPLVISGYGILALTTVISLFAYREIPLSMGPIIESTSYIYVVLFGRLIFHEKINKQKVLALLLIIVGIVVFTLF